MKLIRTVSILVAVCFLSNCTYPEENEPWTIRDAEIKYVSGRPLASGVFATHVELEIFSKPTGLQNVYLPYAGMEQSIPLVGERCTVIGEWGYLEGLVGPISSGRRINQKKLYRVVGKMTCGSREYGFGITN